MYLWFQNLRVRHTWRAEKSSVRCRGAKQRLRVVDMGKKRTLGSQDLSCPSLCSALLLCRTVHRNTPAIERNLEFVGAPWVVWEEAEEEARNIFLLSTTGACLPSRVCRQHSDQCRTPWRPFSARTLSRKNNIFRDHARDYEARVVHKERCRRICPLRLEPWLAERNEICPKTSTTLGLERQASQ